MYLVSGINWMRRPFQRMLYPRNQFLIQAIEASAEYLTLLWRKYFLQYICDCPIQVDTLLQLNEIIVVKLSLNINKFWYLITKAHMKPLPIYRYSAYLVALPRGRYLSRSLLSASRKRHYCLYYRPLHVCRQLLMS